jgi:small subunit ribosomal protein S15
MARLHSKRKGKSGTKRPKSKTTPKWVASKAAEVQELILTMAKEGMPPSKIALFLRDVHGIPNVSLLLGTSLLSFLRKERVSSDYPEDMLNLIKKAVRIRKHLKENKKDVHNKVKLMHVESKIGRLVKYYIKKGILPPDWKYNHEKVALLVK